MIKRISIQNYKSLQNVQMEMQPLMIFVGCNNAGKSNIIDAFEFMSEIVKEGPDAVAKRGGIQQILFNGDSNNSITFELGAQVIDDQSKSHELRYAIAFDADMISNYGIAKEQLFLKKDAAAEIKLLEFPTENGTAKAWNENGKQTGIIGAGKKQSYLRSFLDKREYPIIGHFSNEIQNWAFHKFFPSLMTNVVPVRRDFRLDKYGQNLPAVIHSLQSESRYDFNNIEEALKEMVPEIEILSTGLTEQGQTYIKIGEKHIKIPIPSWAMSDGTLNLLAMLATLNMSNPPSLVCLEEPENYVHPGLLEFVSNLLNKASEKTQIIVTTHSPYLLNFINPGNLFIVEKKEGITSIKKASNEKGIKEALQALGLGEMWYAGSLGGIP
ncbi:MAG: hypothetical protein A2Y62_05830 [Candidatus Fischerbacteria bacterium RBG_13_37_8]|uniref:ATPase AAA-type core domain-containing protein n=1 Tax=Candidatus Fischerbacteria bacterium RBG_13_37_8 TaxID=1817863 RepID=A0A1F5VDE4_9BACT|nr:MAG: hypothetical protein A2Y62_05830 [Candidatus Fischerbacteria bacterium RBG_13_37_8]